MISPALRFHGDCEEAFNLYEKAFHSEYKHFDYNREAPDDSVDKTYPDQVMHAAISIYGSQINASDSVEPVVHGNDLCLNVFVPTGADVKHALDVLSAEGRIVVPLGPQFFSPMYGSVIDKYGYHWQIIAEKA